MRSFVRVSSLVLLLALSSCSERVDAPRTDASAPLDGGVDATVADASIDSAILEAGDEAGDAASEDATADVADGVSEDAGADALDVLDTPDAFDAYVPPPPPCVPVEVGVPDVAADDTALAEVGDASADEAGDAVADEAGDAAAEATDAAGDGVAPEAGAPATCVRLRVVASNLTSGTAQSYEGPGIRILQALHPDVALMQEFKYAGGLRALVDTAFGPGFQYMVEPEAGTIPNGIVSRYPIVESGEWDDPDLTDRDFAWARIDVPGPVDLWAVSVHLRTTSATAREVEAKNLVAYVKAKVPSGVYLVIGGDLNTAVETENALTVFSELLTLSPYAVDQAGNNKTNTSRSKPYDWVMANPLLFARSVPVVLGSHSFPTGLVFDSRVYTPLSEVPPAVSTDSAAANMQHMAVVRDFAL